MQPFIENIITFFRVICVNLGKYITQSVFKHKLWKNKTLKVSFQSFRIFIKFTFNELSIKTQLIYLKDLKKTNGNY